MQENCAEEQDAHDEHEPAGTRTRADADELIPVAVFLAEELDADRRKQAGADFQIPPVEVPAAADDGAALAEAILNLLQALLGRAPRLAPLLIAVAKVKSQAGAKWQPPRRQSALKPSAQPRERLGQV